MGAWVRCLPLVILVGLCGASDSSGALREYSTSGDDATADDSEGHPCEPKLPKGGLYATFRVNDEIFSSVITNATGAQQAIDLWQGRSQANIPVGRLVCKRKRWNCPWTWRQDPRTVEFAEVAIEVCDGLPSFVEESCPTFGAGSYCPFAAELIRLQDCRTSRRCPLVPR